MAVRNLLTNNLPGGREGVELYYWQGLSNATTDTGAPVSLADAESIDVQVTGTLGAGGTLEMQGSNLDDITTFNALTDVAGSAMTFTTLTHKATHCRPLWIRPAVTAGDGTTSLACRVVVVRRRNSA